MAKPWIKIYDVDLEAIIRFACEETYRNVMTDVSGWNGDINNDDVAPPVEWAMKTLKEGYEVQK